ncbi:MAG: hypothetical protein CMJ18_08790 [Phycisphaeraceae bacterium]|nr:hypothetical protein [Phycisphaeraceae bacterium]
MAGHRIALIGAGWHSSTHHAPAVAQYRDEHPGAVEIALCDRDAARTAEIAERHGFDHRFTDVDTLRDRFRPDAAIVVLPVPIMAEMVAHLLEDAVPLLIEKPLGENIGQARRMAAAVRDSGVPVLVSLNRRFDPGLRIALDWLSARGPLRMIRGTMLRARRVDPQFIWSTSIHLLDLMCAIAGPLRATDRGGVVDPACMDGDDSWRMERIEGDHGLAGFVEIMPACGRIMECVRCAGDHFCLDLFTGTHHDWRVAGYEEGDCVLDERAPTDQAEHVRNGTYAETEAFLRAVREGMPLPSPGVDDALASAELVAVLASGEVRDS